MPLAIGARLGSYEILSALGAGGMGEVYRAKDHKLGREVAIKVLPDAVASDPERLARFQREAQVLASLNHPNIAQIYGVEDRALVLELVDGRPLAGPLPAENALQFAKQIADALEAAHDKGIIHRDLKPANIMITPAGTVKVLDFGLAKAQDEATSFGDPANSPTLTMSPTRAGMILGTAAYMSPEQARGKPVDKRADIWAFGVVLAEMLTGHQTFTGETITDILASVVKEQPGLERLPPRIHAIVERCLRKDPRQRWQAIGDVRVEIEALLADPRGVLGGEPRAARQPLWKRVLPVLGALALAATSGIAAWYFRPAPAPALTRFSVPLGDGQQFSAAAAITVVAISPDGTQMVYAANNQLYLRSMAEMDARPIPGTSGDTRYVVEPVFSPDSRSMVYYSQADSSIKRIAVSGGAPVTISPIDFPFAFPMGISWTENGILFGTLAKGILRVSPNGGKPETVVAIKAEEVAVAPQMLPDGKTLLFTIAKGGSNFTNIIWDKAQVVAQTLASGKRKVLIDGGSFARYLPTGHLVYALGGTLFAQKFDASRQEVSGGPVGIVEGVMRQASPQFDFSATGSLIYIPGPVSSAAGQRALVLIDRDGTVTPLKLAPGPYNYPRVSPGGKRIAFVSDDGKEAAIYIYDLSGGTSMRRLTFGGANRFPVWSADGERVAFQSDREGDSGIFWQRADGTGAVERLTKPEKDATHIPDSFSPDGQTLLFTTVGTNSTEWVLSLRDKKAAALPGVPQKNFGRAAFSPDGHWLAYQSDETGNNEIFVQPFPPTGVKYQISHGGDNHSAQWSPDGKELFWIPGPGGFVVASISTRPTLTFGTPMPLPRRFSEGGPVAPRTLDMLPDGKHFVGVSAAGQAQGAVAAPQIRVVLNWFEDVKQRVPAK